MQKQFLSALLLVAAVIVTSVTACKKEENADDRAKADQAAQALRTQQLISSSFGIALRGADEADGLVSGDVDDRCGTLIITPADPAVFPKVITADFGTGCTDSDGKTKSGKVILTFGKIWEPGSEISIEYDQYKEDGNSLQGKFTFQNLSTSTAGVFKILAADIKASDANGYSISYDAEETFTQTAGHPTWWDWSDDVYDITGSIDAVLTNGETVKWNIQDPLVKANNCFWVSKGTGTLDLNGLAIGVDYGDGSCDNKGTVTINGQTYQIML